jgi:hypothetical protein
MHPGFSDGVSLNQTGKRGFASKCVAAALWHPLCPCVLRFQRLVAFRDVFRIRLNARRSYKPRNNLTAFASCLPRLLLQLIRPPDEPLQDK